MLRLRGLRSRLVVALLATSAVTLLAAALALLSPLQHRLREQSAAGLRAAALSARPQFEDAIRRDGGIGFRTARLADQLNRRANARVAVYDTTPLADLAGHVDTGTAPDRIDDVFRVLATNHTVTSSDEDGTRIAAPLCARPCTTAQLPGFVLAMRKPATDTTETVDEVRDAFIKAALIGLGAALLLGLVLANTLTRRLERLRRSALRITREGMDAPAPHDITPDEVGDLARAMAAMQAALRRQERARRQFVATASHELRTPLTSLSGTLELLGEDLADGELDREDARTQVAKAEVELRRLRNLATELLDLSRLDAGVELRSEPVELGEIARAVAAEFELRAESEGRAIAVLAPPAACWARGDPDAAARVVRILVDNALRYAPAGSTVHVGAAYHGDSATLTVADDGPGVQPEERELIFDRFHRGRAASRESGFGLGLAIGRELAERLGGRLDLDGGPPGARFVLALAIELPAGSRAVEPVTADQS